VSCFAIRSCRSVACFARVRSRGDVATLTSLFVLVHGQPCSPALGAALEWRRGIIERFSDGLSARFDYVNACSSGRSRGACSSRDLGLSLIVAIALIPLASSLR